MAMMAAAAIVAIMAVTSNVVINALVVVLVVVVVKMRRRRRRRRTLHFYNLQVPCGPRRGLDLHVGAGAVEVVVADQEGLGEVEPIEAVAQAAVVLGMMHLRLRDVGRTEDGLACVRTHTCTQTRPAARTRTRTRTHAQTRKHTGKTIIRA